MKEASAEGGESANHLDTAFMTSNAPHSSPFVIGRHFSRASQRVLARERKRGTGSAVKKRRDAVCSHCHSPEEGVRSEASLLRAQRQVFASSHWLYTKLTLRPPFPQPKQYQKISSWPAPEEYFRAPSP